jgi:hypothetical protein
LRPPIGITRPRSVISPVIATSRRTGIFISALETIDGRDGHARARAVLRHELGEVHVHVELAVELLVEAEHLLARADVAHRRLRGLLHAPSELAGDHELALAGHHRPPRTRGGRRRLRVREAVREADLVVLARLGPERYFGTPRYFGTFFAAMRYCLSLLLVLGVAEHLARDLAADAADLALEVRTPLSFV